MDIFKKTAAGILALCLPLGFTACAAKPQNTAYDIKDAQIQIKDKAAWKTPNLFDSGFYLEIQSADETVEKLQIGGRGTEKNSAEGKERTARAEEWGYSFYNLDGVTDGIGRKISADWKAADRQEALAKIFTFLNKQYKSQSESGVYYSMNGHYPFHHYAGEAGFQVLGTEIGENINSYQWRIASNRGAARQYNTPWFVDFSMWNSGTILDYSDGKIWEQGSLNGGHSLSLFERAMLMSYMAGASSLVAEGGDKLVVDQSGQITPYGEVCKKLNSFAKQQSAGIPYTPIGIVLDYYHGTYSGIGKKLAFNQFAYNKGDKMTDSLLHMIWGDGIAAKPKQTESSVLHNNQYGDLFDVLLQNADLGTLSSYPCLLLTGNIELSSAEAGRYTQYVQNGGTLLLNTAYTDQFAVWKDKYKTGNDPYSFTYGSGTVTVYGKAYSTDALPALLMEQKAKYVPFSFSHDIEHMINVTDDAVILTLINNDGITKKPDKKEKISKKELELTVQTSLANVKSVKEIYNQKEIDVQKDKATVRLQSGDIAVLVYTLA